MGVASDVREVIQELVAPDLKANGAKLDALRESFAALEGRQTASEQRQSASEERTLKVIAQSEEKILLTLKLALLSQGNEQLLKKVNDVEQKAQ